MPVRSRSTKLYSATSPSMNDQWSGKTLRRLLRRNDVASRRSSTHVAISSGRIRIIGPSQKLGPTGAVKSPVARRPPSSSISIGSWGSGRGARAVDRLGAVEHVERGLVARAAQLVGLGQVEAQRAPGVGADLRVHDEAVGRAGEPVGRELQLAGFDADQHRLGVRRADEPFGEDGRERAHLERVARHRRAVVQDEAGAVRPLGREQRRIARRAAQGTDREQRRQPERSCGSGEQPRQERAGAGSLLRRSAPSSAAVSMSCWVSGFVVVAGLGLVRGTAASAASPTRVRPAPMPPRARNSSAPSTCGSDRRGRRRRTARGRRRSPPRTRSPPPAARRASRLGSRQPQHQHQEPQPDDHGDQPFGHRAHPSQLQARLRCRGRGSSSR